MSALTEKSGDLLLFEVEEQLSPYLAFKERYRILTDESGSPIDSWSAWLPGDEDDPCCGDSEAEAVYLLADEHSLSGYKEIQWSDYFDVSKVL